MPPRSRSDVSFAKTTLPYPIFAADFDPYNRGYLVVGGGGGESKSGVPNGVTVLDTSNRAKITTALDIDLSRDEDSVQSIGNLATKDGLIVFAGINSSAKEQEAGRNEHLRAFDLKYPPRKKQKTEDSDEKAETEDKGQWKLLGKRSLFAPSRGGKTETYQRILRLSPSKKTEDGSKRIGAMATGLAKNSQVIVFNATNPTPDKADVLTTIDLDPRQEAADLDISLPEDDSFSIAYCTDDGIHEQTLKYDFKSKKTEKTPKGPRRVYHMPFPDSMEDPKSRPKFRCLRFLNSQNVVALSNKPNKGGAEVRIFHLYPTGPAIMVGNQALPSHVKGAVSMDVCALDVGGKGADAGNQQFVIAVAGNDISIEVFTVNYTQRTDTFSSFKKYITIRNVHEHQMTKLCFSPFHSPPRELAPGKVRLLGPQFIRLASVSYGNTVVVDTFPVQPLDPNDLKGSRYVLSHPSDERFAKIAYVFVTFIVVVVIAFIAQSFRGGFSDAAVGRGPFSYLPKEMREKLDGPPAPAYGQKYEFVSSVASSSIPTHIVLPDNEIKGRLQKLVEHHQIPTQDTSSSPQTSQDKREKTLIIRSAPEGMGGVTVDVHPDKEAYRSKNSESKHWDELEEQQKMRWRDRLRQAGQWAEGEGEIVLTGILFSEYAGMVGEAAGEVLREL